MKIIEIIKNCRNIVSRNKAKNIDRVYAFSKTVCHIHHIYTVQFATLCFQFIKRRRSS